MISVAAVVAAMVGKALISGLARESAVAVVPPPSGTPGPANSTTIGIVSASTSGGITIGPNRLRRRTSNTLMTLPTKKHAVNSSPGRVQSRTSASVPMAVGTIENARAAHQAFPRTVGKAERSAQARAAPSFGLGAFGRSRVAVTAHNRNARRIGRRHISGEVVKVLLCSHERVIGGDAPPPVAAVDDTVCVSLDT